MACKLRPKRSPHRATWIRESLIDQSSAWPWAGALLVAQAGDQGFFLLVDEIDQREQGGFSRHG